jgi:GT2 family glycosyltransferase
MIRSGAQSKVAVLMATFDRVDVTRRSLNALERAFARVPDLEAHVYVVDASSPDGTAAVIAAEYPHLRIRTVPIDHYWARSMRVAWEMSQAASADYYLWLNDDVVLDEDAISRVVSAQSNRIGDEVLVGSMRDPDSGQVTYSGRNLGTWWNRLTMSQVEPEGSFTQCDAANGNFVWIPAGVDKAVGGFPKGYVHGLADYAYTLRARRLKYSVLVMFPSVGTCKRNPDWRQGYSGMNWIDRLRRASSAKGTPPREWARYCFRYGGLAAPLSFLTPYLGALRHRL